MSNVIVPAVPNLPVATLQYLPAYQDQFANVLRLYFNLLNNATQQNANDISSLSVGAWMANGGGLFSG